VAPEPSCLEKEAVAASRDSKEATVLILYTFQSFLLEKARRREGRGGEEEGN
jgi:hypothetical protein